MSEQKIPIPARLYNAAVNGHVAGTEDIIDDNKNKTQQEINTDVDTELENHQQQLDNKYNKSEVYSKSETYNKTELNNMITTPSQEYVTVTATDQTTAVTDVLPATGEADTVYRVGNWDGTQYNDSVFSEYAWNGSAYIKLSTKSQIGEVYDISANHADTKYADLSAALGTNGANVPVGVRRGGMSVKFVQSSDNKYVQYRLMAQAFSTTESDWQGVDEEPTAESDNLVKSGGVYLQKADSDFVSEIGGDTISIFAKRKISANTTQGILYGSNKIVSTIKSGTTFVVYVDNSENVLSGNLGVSCYYKSAPSEQVYLGFFQPSLFGELGKEFQAEQDIYALSFSALPANVSNDGDIVVTIGNTTSEVPLNTAVYNVSHERNNDSSYNSAEAARNAVPKYYQKKGLIISYLLADGWHIEQFVGALNYSANDIYWEEVYKDSNINKLLFIQTEEGGLNADGTNYSGTLAGHYRTGYIQIKQFYKAFSNTSNASGGWQYMLFDAKKTKIYGSGWSTLSKITKADLSEIDGYFGAEYIRIEWRNQTLLPVQCVGFENLTNGKYYIVGYRIGNNGAIQDYTTGKQYAYCPKYLNINDFDSIWVNEGYIIEIVQYNSSYNAVGYIESKGNWLYKSMLTKNCQYVRISVKKRSYTSITDASAIGFYINLPKEKILDNKVIISNPINEKLAHGSYAFSDLQRGYRYYCYYSGATATIEQPTDTDINVKVCKQEIANPYNKQIVTVLDKGETVGTFTQDETNSPYDPNIYELDADNLRVWMVVCRSGDNIESGRSIGYRDVSKDSLALVNSVNICNITYTASGNSYTVPMKISDLNIMADRLRGTAEGTHRLGMYPVLNGIRKIGNDLYTFLTFISGTNHVSLAPSIIKSSDNGANWEIVSLMDETYDDSRMWEVGWDFHESMIYAIIRRCADTSSVPVISYNITSGQWSNPKLMFNGVIEDSRSALSYKDGLLYVAQNTIECFISSYGIIRRSRVRFAKTTTDFDVVSTKDLIGVDGLSYYSIISELGRYLILYSEDFRHNINYSKGDIALSDITEFMYTI